MTDSPTPKIKVKIIELLQKLDELNTTFLKFQISYISSDEVNSIEEIPKNVFILDSINQLIAVVQEYQNTISECDHLFADVEYKKIQKPKQDEIQGNYDMASEYHQRFFDLEHNIYEGVCDLGSHCVNANPSNLQIQFLTDECSLKTIYQFCTLAILRKTNTNTSVWSLLLVMLCLKWNNEAFCVNQDCPLLDENSPLIPSTTHQGSLERLFQYLQEKLDNSNLHITIEFDTNNTSLQKVDWGQLVRLFHHDAHQISMAYKFPSNQSKDNLTNISIVSAESFDILVIYLNNLYYPTQEKLEQLEQLNDREKKEEILKKSNQDWKTFIKNSKQRWKNFQSQNQGIRVHYVESPSEQDFEQALKASYQMVIVEGHGPTPEGYIELTPISDNCTTRKQISQKFFLDCFKQIQGLQIVCLLMCNSDQLAKKLVKKAELVVACHHLLAVSVFSQWEISLHNTILRIKDNNRKNLWTSIFQMALSSLKTGSDVGSISLESIDIYQRFSIPPVFKHKTDLSNDNKLRKIKIFLINYYKIVLGSMVGMVSLIALLFWVILHFKLRNIIPDNLQPKDVLQNSIISIVDSSYSGFIFSKYLIENSNIYQYYAIVVVKDVDNKDDLKIRLKSSKFQKEDKPVKGEIIEWDRAKDEQWDIISFESSVNIPIPAVKLKSLLIEDEIVKIWGHDKSHKESDLDESLNGYNLEVRKAEVTDNDDTLETVPLGYDSMLKKIEETFIGGPIVYKNCIIGVHLEGEQIDESEVTSNIQSYRGQLMSNIQKTLENSDNEELKQIAQNMNKCH